MLLTFLACVRHALGRTFEFWHKDTEQAFHAQGLIDSPSKKPSNEDDSDHVKIRRETYNSLIELLQLHAYSIEWRRTQSPKAAAMEELRERIMQIHNKICEVRGGVETIDTGDKEAMLQLLDKHMDTTGSALRALGEQVESLNRAQDELGASRDQMTLALASRLEMPRTLPQRLHHPESDLTVKASPLDEDQMSRIEEEIQEVQQAILQSFKKPLEEEDNGELVEPDQPVEEV